MTASHRRAWWRSSGWPATFAGRAWKKRPWNCLYVPLAQIPEDVVSFLANNFFWVARTSQSPAALRNPVRREIHAVDGDVAAAAIQPMTQYLDQSFAVRRE
jgi:hypothetical protein